MAAPNRLVSLAFEAVTTPHIHGGYSVLHAACMEKDVRTCRTILSCSPSKLDTIIALNVRVPKRLIDTCQTKATLRDLAKNRNCSSELLQVLEKVRLGVPVDCQSTWGRSALHMAAVKGHAETLAVLIHNGADLHASTGFGDTALLLAAEEGCLECVKTLVQNGSSVDMSNMACYTPLHNAAKEGHLEVVSYLQPEGPSCWSGF